MNKTSLKLFLLCLMLGAAAQPSLARIKSTIPSLLANNGFVLLHPYFNGKPWKISYDKIAIDSFPDTFLVNNPLQPVSFDIGKNVDSAIAVFTTAQGDLFLMQTSYVPYFGACESGGIGFGRPHKISAAATPLTGLTPIYLIKEPDPAGDSVRVVVGSASSLLSALTIKLSTNTVIKTDTLSMQNAGAIVRIVGDYSTPLQRDTCIWALGANGTIRSFSVSPTAWGAERKWDIAGLSDTVKCLSGQYAGTHTGKIYRKNASQSFTLENSGSTKAINAMYPDGAVGSQGTILEHAGASWRTYTYGASTFTYGNFIRRPGGFGVELLDSKWKYDAYTYRDSASKISLIIPGEKFAYVNNGTWVFTNPDTGGTIYLLDPDSNYKDLDMALKHNQTKTTLLSDGTATLAAIPDSESCHVGAARLTDGILYLRLQQNQITIKAKAEFGAQKPNCGTCYWKKNDFSVIRQWARTDTIFIKTGLDVLKIANYYNPVTVSLTRETSGNPVKCTITADRLVLRFPLPNLKAVSIFDASGRRICSQPITSQSTVYLARSFARGVLFVELAFTNGAFSRMTLPVIR